MNDEKLKCVDCINWIPLEKEVSGFCYKQPIYKQSDGAPVFKMTHAFNPCDDFYKRSVYKKIDWPKHIYGAGSIIVPILLWIATHGGKLFAHNTPSSKFPSNYKAHLEILRSITNRDESQDLGRSFEFEDLTKIQFPQERLHFYFENDASDQYRMIDENDRFRLEFTSIDAAPDNVKWKVCNAVLNSLGSQRISQWVWAFSLVEEYLKTVHGDDDALTLRRA